MARGAKEAELEHNKRMLSTAGGFQPDFLSLIS
jgi:hypothetical protein